MMTIGYCSQKVTRASSDRQELNIGMKSLTKLESVMDVTRAGSTALQMEADSIFQVLNAVTREYRLGKDTSLNELEGLRELKTGSAVHQKINLVLAKPPNNRRGPKNQFSCAHEVFYEQKVENAVKFMSSTMTPGAHGHIFSPHLMFFHRIKSLRWQTKKVRVVKNDLNGSKEKVSHVPGTKDLALIYTTILKCV